MLQVTPNGGLGKDVHPHVPVRLDEVLADLRACLTLGATGVHLHPRDASGAESLDPEAVNEAGAAVRALARELGKDVEIGLTTGAWIEPDLERRIELIRSWQGVDIATVNLCEPGWEQVMTAMEECGIGVDVGLWGPSEVDPLLESGWAHRAQRISLELGPDAPPHHLTGDPVEIARGITARLSAARVETPLLIHGEAEWTWPLVAEAVAQGQSTRVGFEDSVHLPDGTPARSNAELVRAAALVLAGHGG